MKKLLILIFIFGFGQLIKAQEKGLSFGMGGILEIRLNNSYINYQEIFSYYPTDIFPYQQLTDFFKSGFGVQINYKFNDKIGLRSGILYSRKGYKLTIKSSNLSAPFALLKSEFSFNYLDVPLSIYYQVIKSNRYTLSPSLGIMNNIYIGQSNISEMRNGKIHSSNSYLLGARLGLINNFNLGSNIFISFEPYLMFNFYNVNNTGIKKPEIPFGGHFSVNYKFNKK